VKISKSLQAKLKLTDEEVAVIQDSVVHDSALIEFLTKYIAYRCGSLKTSEWDFDKPNWEFRRAFLDGRINELNWLQTLLTKGETHD
jgi:hypothetical protein